MGKFRMPTGYIGDLNISWDSNSKEDVKEAKILFKDLRVKGYKFVALVDGKMKKIKNFDPKASQILVIPKVSPGC